MIKQFDGSNIFFMEDGWFNATVAAKAFNKEADDWLRSDDAFVYGKALAKSLNLMNPPTGGVNEMLHFLEITKDKEQRRNVVSKFLKEVGLSKTKRGSTQNGGGTWLHPELVVKFARWLSVEFELWCDKQIKEIIQQSTPRPSAYFRPHFPTMFSHELGFEVVTPQEDDFCKGTRRTFDFTIKKFCGFRNPRRIQELTNLVFKIFTGFTVADFRRGWGIMPGSRIRTRLFVDSNLRRAIDEVEMQVNQIIQVNQMTDYGLIFQVVEDAANLVALHCRLHRIRLGQSVPVNLRLVG